MFIAPPGHVFVAMDLSQAETWVSAHLAREPTMIKALKEDDIHCVTAAFLFDLERDKVSKSKTPTERYIGKKSNHSFTYRQGYLSFTTNFNKESVDLGISISNYQGKTYWYKWNQLYILQPWWDEIEEKLSRTRTLTTVYGRVRRFFGAWGKELLNEGTAYEPQSTVADHAWGKEQDGINKEGGIIGIAAFCKRNNFHFVHTAYDSVMCVVPNNEKTLSDIIPQLYNMFYRPLCIHGETFHIPVDIELGERWGELESYKIKQ